MNNSPTITADFLEAGSGPTVMLVHSSVSGARQWRRLIDDLKADFHVRAVNLFGYGETPPWPMDQPQTLEDQARLVETALPAGDEPLCLVGHSFGAVVAMKVALSVGFRLASTVRSARRAQAIALPRRRLATAPTAVLPGPPRPPAGAAPYLRVDRAGHARRHAGAGSASPRATALLVTQAITGAQTAIAYQTVAAAVRGGGVSGAGVREGDAFTVRVDGAEVTAYDGDSVAAVLVRDGRASWRRTRRGGRPRGLFCGIGACQDRLATVDGVRGVRACVAPAAPGAEITTVGADE